MNGPSHRRANRADSRQVHELVCFYALGTLDAVDREAFEGHLLAGCRACEAELRVFREVAVHIGSQASSIPAATVRERLLNGIHSDTAAPPPGLRIGSSAEIAWKSLGQGVSVKPLYKDSERHRLTALVRLEPGAFFPQRPPGEIEEEVFVISGDLELAGATLRAGDFYRAEAGTERVDSFSRAGCLLLFSGAPVGEDVV